MESAQRSSDIAEGVASRLAEDLVHAHKAHELFRATAIEPAESLGVLAVRCVRFALGWSFTLLMATLCLAGSIVGLRRLAYTGLGRPWAQGLLRMSGMHVSVEHPERLAGPALFMSNHHSFIDVIFVVTLLPRTSRFVVRKELRDIPLWGWAAGDGLIALDRSKPGTALDHLKTGMAELPEGWSLSIYPEGTRTKDGRLSPLRKGVFHIALQSRLPIVPIGSWGAAGIIPLGTILPRSGPIETTVGEPISTEHWRAEDIDEHMAELRAALAAVTDASRRRYEERYGVCEPKRRVGSALHELVGLRPRPAAPARRN